MTLRGLRLFVASCALALTGCAQLRLDVDVYRGPLPAALDVRAAAMDAQRVTNASVVEAKRQEVFAGARRFIDESIDRSQKDPKRAADQKQLSWFGAVPGGGVFGALQSAWDPVARAAQDVNALAIVISQPDDAAPSGVSSALLRREVLALNREWATFVSEANTALRGHFVDGGGREWVASTRDNPFRIVGIAAATEVSGRLAGSPVFDPNIGRLGRDSEAWVSFGSNAFDAGGGTSQFVVVREGLVVFHQKSLDFDPTPAVGAGTAVARLGLKIGAAVATGGISAATTTAATGTAGQTAATPALDAEAAERDRAVIERARATRLDLLTSLAATLDAALQNDATVAATKARLKADLSFYLGRLSSLKEISP